MKIRLIVVGIILLLGLLLRAQESISGNFLFLLDSGRDMMDVKKIVFDHKLTFIGPYTSLGGVFQGPLYYYLLTIPTLIFRGDPWGNILLMLVISLAVLAVVFYGMRRYFCFIPAVITTTLFSFSPEAIAAATYFWNPHPMWLVITIYIFLLHGAVLGDKRSQIALWPVIALSFHFQTAFGVFLAVATFVYIALFERDRLLRNKHIRLGFGLAAALFIPQMLFELRHNFLMTRSILDMLWGAQRGLITGGERGDFSSILANNYITLKNNFISSFIHEKQFGFVPVLMTILTAISYIYGHVAGSFSKKEYAFLRAITTITGIIVALGLLYPFPLRYWFLTGFQSFYLVVFGLILSKGYSRSVGKIGAVILMVLMVWYGVVKLDELYIHPPNDGGHAKIRGKKQAIDYMYEDANGTLFSVMVFTPPVLTDAYDYLFWWYGNKTYGYRPQSEKTGVVYLLIEPDPEKPWSYNGWLETVVKKGSVESTTVLPSGLIVQKRFMTL